MLQMIDYEQQSLEARRKMQSRMGYPMVGLGLDYSLIGSSSMSSSEMNGKDMIMPMLSVSLPVGQRKYRAMQAETAYLQQAAEQNRKAAANELQNEYYSALQDYRDAGRRMDLYARQSELSQSTLSLALASFSASGAGLGDVLAVRRQLLEYSLSGTKALADFNTAAAQLRKLAAIAPFE